LAVVPGSLRLGWADGGHRFAIGPPGNHAPVKVHAVCPNDPRLTSGDTAREGSGYRLREMPVQQECGSAGTFRQVIRTSARPHDRVGEMVVRVEHVTATLGVEQPAGRLLWLRSLSGGCG
jgi:hypothetical protein